MFYLLLHNFLCMVCNCFVFTMETTVLMTRTEVHGPESFPSPLNCYASSFSVLPCILIQSPIYIPFTGMLIVTNTIKPSLAPSTLGTLTWLRGVLKKYNSRQKKSGLFNCHPHYPWDFFSWPQDSLVYSCHYVGV